MTEIVYQGDDIGNTIDEWLSKDNSVLPNSTKTIGNVGSIAINLDTKGGLGYQPTKGSSNNNKLADSLKKNKNKRKNGNEEELLETEQHGVVEEELLSRSTMGSKAKVTKHILNQQPEKKKAKNSEAGQGAATKNSDQTSNNDSNSALIRDKSQNVNEKTMKVEDHAENYDKNYWKQYKGGDFNEGDAPRKKSKTRSKQKNIRRDNRPALSRPSHLQIGSSDYAGRPLTYETKAKLGVAEAKAGAGKGGNSDKNRNSSPMKPASSISMDNSDSSKKKKNKKNKKVISVESNNNS